MRTILAFSFCVLSALLNAQNTFQKSIGGTNDDYGYGIQTFDGGYAFAGGTNSFGAGSHDVYFVRTNAWGDIVWTKTIGGSDYENVECISQTTDSGYVIAGSTRSFGAGSNDVLVIRLTKDGTVLWEKTYGGIQDDYATSAIETHDGNFLIGGSTATYGSGGYDCYLIKTDGNGNLTWTRTYGGAQEDVISAIIETPDSNYVACGRCVSTPDLLSNLLLFKTDTAGDTLWTKSYGVNGTVDYAYDVSTTSDGGLAIAGINNFLNDQKSLIIKTDPMGDTMWTRSYYTNGTDVAWAIKGIAQNRIAFTGWTYQLTGDEDMTLGELDQSGNLLWMKNYGGSNSDIGTSIVQTSDQGFMVTGGTLSFGSGNNDIFICKTDSVGNSGCNQTQATTYLSPTAIDVSSFPMNVSSGGSSQSIVMSEDAGGVAYTECFTGIASNYNDNTDNSIFPNPASSDFVFLKTDFRVDRCEIYDLNGALISNEIPDSNKQIRIPDKTGIYLIKIYHGPEYEVQKLVRL